MTVSVESSPRWGRRQFLATAGGLALSQGLSACGAAGDQPQVRFLQGSIPRQLIRRYQSETSGEDLGFEAVSQLQSLWETLETWGRPPAVTGLRRFLPRLGSASLTPPSLLTLGDYWLQKAVAQNLLQPLPLEGLAGWQTLDSRWQGLTRRNAQGFPAQDGRLWGAPYRWGTTLLVYQKSRFQNLDWTPRDWSDLWRSELRQRLALPDQPREVIGLTLKKLGYSYNDPRPQSHPELEPALAALQRQVKFYSNRHSLQSLLNGDVWLAVGWSNEVLPLLKTRPELAAVTPRSGASLWADLWVAPKGESLTAFLPWIEACWRPESANQISLLAQGGAPGLASLPPAEILPAVRDNPLVYLSPELWRKCEFLLPLAPGSLQAYQDLWRKMRASAPV
ncbi:MAG: extracellular solute-binding protein [Cyanobacteria bacterium RI_101]|nr:extracellular solute-binding protein [Cyanobacteria bacterium RI_101]